MTTEQIIEHIKVDQQALTSEMINDLVESHRTGRGKEVLKLEQRYRQKKEAVPILRQEAPNPHKVNERIPNDFFGDIVDTKTGYMGNEVVAGVEKEQIDNNALFNKAADALHDFAVLNFSVDANSEQVKTAAVSGAGFRLLYIPEGRNEIRVKNLPASETVVYRDESLDEITYAMRYWYVDDQSMASGATQRTVVEWYDDEMITYYIDNGKGEYSVDVAKGNGGMQPHLFDGVPILEFPNNEERMGEAEKVLGLIDAYDKVTSATVSEIEQLRLAYMLVKGLGLKIDNAFIRNLEQTGCLGVDKDGDAKFITKDLAVDGVKIILDEIRTNIYEFARSIDLSRDYGGDLRVIGWQVALLNLENSCKVTERKFKKALLDQYRLICAKWKEWGVVDLNYLDITFSFTRNFPKDVGSEAETLGKLIGLVSRKTAYEQMSFIEDPEAEIEAFEEEREANMALSGLFDDTESGNTPEDDTDETDEE